MNVSYAYIDGYVVPVVYEEGKWENLEKVLKRQGSKEVVEEGSIKKRIKEDIERLEKKQAESFLEDEDEFEEEEFGEEEYEPTHERLSDEEFDEEEYDEDYDEEDWL